MLEKTISWHNEHVTVCQADVSITEVTMPFGRATIQQEVFNAECGYRTSIALLTAMLCHYCEAIDFSALPLQQDEEDRSPAWYSLPLELQQSDVGQYYYHPHHPSLPDLFDCSVRGCHFCIQIRRELFNIRNHESEEKHHQGHVEIRYYPHEAKVENDCRRLEIFAVALTPLRHVKLPFDFISPPGMSQRPAWLARTLTPTAWLGTLLAQKSSLVPLSPKCQPNFELARNWMQICLESHKKCSHGELLPTLPTRILELFDDDDNETIRLTSKGSMRSRYVTLSHVWGKKQIIRTLLENITQHHVAIPVEKLSKTFHEAVITTRKLGIRYLWIDSLCIIQDSKEDWGQEASKMGAYYRNSTLTIAAVSAKSGEDGLFFKRDFFAINPCPLQLRFASPQGLEQGFMRPTLSWDSVSETSGFQRPPLWQRAWVLQERILSSRLLQFSDVQMSWRCHEFEASERLVEGSSKFFGHGRIEEALHSVIFGEDDTSSRKHLPNTAKEDDHLDLYNAWYDLVTLYTKCDLTVSTDIFPAISGIARLLGSELGHDYCAGIWKRDMHRGLVWTSPDSTLARTALQSYRAPSWSWAAAPATVNFTVREILQKDIDFTVLKIRDIEIESTPDAYGEVKHATLEVAGLLRSAHLSQGLTREQIAGMDTGEDQRDNRLFDLDLKRSVGLFYPDTSDNKLRSEVWCLLVWTEKSIVPSKRTREGKGLALKKLDAETGTFMRVGSVWVTDNEWMEQMQPANLSIV